MLSWNRLSVNEAGSTTFGSGYQTRGRSQSEGLIPGKPGSQDFALRERA